MIVMTHRLLLSFVGLVATAATAISMAQTPSQQEQTDPKAASSPHHREATSTDATEAPATTETEPAAAASPHQEQATREKVAAAKGKAEREQMMNECVKNERMRDSTLSAEQAKKTCTDQMKSHESETRHRER
jgi:hypothetical protein